MRRRPWLFMLLLGLPIPGMAAQYHGRGVYYFDGPVRSPLAGIGTRGAYATNRIALDDDHTTVSLDAETQRIVFANAHRYSSATIIGDLVLLGSGENQAGDEVPFGIHLKIEKRGDTFKAQVHPHPTSRDKLSALRFATYTVVTRGAADESTVLTPTQARKSIEQPELTARLASIFIQATDHLEGQLIRPELPDARLVDVSIGFGIQKLNLTVARIELISEDTGNATLVRQASIGDMLEHGAWELRITSKTWLPKEEFNRDLFLFGLDSIGFLDRLTKHGLPLGEALAIGFRNGHGFVQLGDAHAEIANAADTARAYLEFHFIGGIVARQVATLPQRLAAPASPTPPP